MVREWDTSCVPVLRRYLSQNYSDEREYIRNLQVEIDPGVGSVALPS